jgi:hypothetical protein
MALTDKGKKIAALMKGPKKGVGMFAASQTKGANSGAEAQSPLKKSPLKGGK